MAALEELLGDLVRRHGIPPARILGHSDVAPTRKHDPGELFDWRRLAGKGLAIWPDAKDVGDTHGDTRAMLTSIGYDADAPLASVVAAFQRRFAQDTVTGEADPETRRIIGAVYRLSQ